MIGEPRRLALGLTLLGWLGALVAAHAELWSYALAPGAGAGVGCAGPGPGAPPTPEPGPIPPGGRP